MKKLLLLGLILSLVAAACNLPGGFLESPTPPVEPLPPTPVSTQPPPPTETPKPVLLTPQMLENMAYTLPGFEDREFTFQLKEGIYQSGSDPAALDYVSIALGDALAFGDLNGDGSADAAIFLAMNFGGTGVFTWLVAVLNENGSGRQAGRYLVDDRPMIRQLLIEDGQIKLEAIVHGPNDPGCCPEQPVKRSFRVTPGGLALVYATTQLGETPRDIQIDSPLEDSRVSGSLEVRGGVSVVPFEATLNYRIYSERGEEYQVGYIMVDAPDYGQPGTFVKTIDLSGIPSGVIYLEIAELSAADGSVVTLRAVRLIVE